MFHVIERRIWRKFVIVGLLLCLAGVFYWAAKDDTLSVYSTRLREWMFGIVVGPSGEEEEAATDGESATVAEVPDQEDAIPALFGLGETPPEEPAWEFDGFRYERDRADAQLLEELLALLQMTGADIGQEVQMEVVRLLAKANRETQAEALLRAQGLGDALVVMTGSGAYVVLDREITQFEASRVGDIVARIAELPLDHITISDGVSLR